jgi:hypothetical protein
MERNKNFIVGVYSDADEVVKAVKKIRTNHIKVHEVYSPFAIHGIDEALGYKRSRMPVAAFLFGMAGTILALTMQFWMMGIDWPMIIGGKNFASLPPFIPVTFELTVLISALGMVGVFMIVSDLKPYKKPKLMDLRITDDKHIIAVDVAANKVTKKDIKKIFEETGAEEVNEKNFD